MDVIQIREVSLSYKNKVDIAKDSVKSPESAASIIRKLLPDNVREHFIALYLDGSHSVIGYSVVFTGTANSCNIHPREIFQNAIMLGAVAIIVGHNHPSGKVDPSDADQVVTNRLRDSGKLLDIKLLDHCVVTDDNYWSFSENGRLF